MVEREFSEEAVQEVLDFGKEIEDYPDDFPYPSRLIMGWLGTRPVHVVAANSSDNEIIVITVYEPDLERWEPGFERRKIQ